MFIKKILISLSLFFISLFIFNSKFFAITSDNVIAQMPWGETINTEWVLNKFKTNSNFDYNSNSYITFSVFRVQSSNGYYFAWVGTACPNISNYTSVSYSSNTLSLKFNSCYYFMYSTNRTNGNVVSGVYGSTNGNVIFGNYTSSNFWVVNNGNNTTDPNNGMGYTNFNFPSLSSSVNNIYNKLDFSPYLYKTYNPNLLDDDSNWTKHCLSGQDTFFSVLPNTIDTSNHDLVNNYILFPYYLHDYGINWLQYNTINSTNLYENNYDISFTYDFKLSSSDEMDSLLSSNLYIQEFNSRYSGLYNSMYGWNIFLNRIQYTSDDKYNIQVFYFDNSYTLSPFCHVVGGSTYCEDSNGNIHGGGGRTHDEVIDIPTRDICFYIPSNMYLKIWNVNEFGDIDDTITLNGTDYNIDTDSYQFGYNYNINNNTYNGYVGYFKTLINTCSIPLAFISNKITLFFNSMPPLIQYSLITFVFVLLVVGLIKFLTGGK